ncbi:tyrosine-type recombinase/integrase [Sinomicrobium weinanense]|uniref:Tyrosine recombinase XerC n=1 Tax=Sinomicrobium weinanense TaxID=2842200 RepID=A0A926Q3Y3_9FLAO|nr:tyrosine-type recombinase/integrase [Sinomicrobium weinanense]MBC9796496.1 tyrosine-type recombinase/integrase [Sinomicrobium weinanense]MBU3123512.1 tyrosine-type recombinase/integrase [Sinomicrobium weinanense]
MSVSAFLEYLRLEKNYSAHTVRAYKRDLEFFTDFCLSEYDVEGIREAAYPLIRNWIVKLVDDGLSNRTVNRKIASLNAYYKFLVRIKDIKVNPLAKHKSLKTPKKVEVPFSEEEMQAVLRVISYKDDFEGLRDQCVIELFYATGMRRSELMNLKVGDIDFSAGTIKILGKRNKERVVPLLRHLRGVIKAYLEKRKEVATIASGDILILVKNGNKIYETLVYRVINRYFSEVSFKVKKSPHILRHTFATHILNKGADLNSVKELLGHSSLASTQVYTHNSIAQLKKVYGEAHPRNKK